jgi:hypothetical protein
MYRLSGSDQYRKDWSHSDPKEDAQITVDGSCMNLTIPTPRFLALNVFFNLPNQPVHVSVNSMIEVVT